ncbi:TIGR04283 family arsenosugar biosynthesis glycosyltransferase [Thiohalobacter sp. IOR34]|uniref:TIGR04283 family arsenosugar biosynthesis glycosyltransferase n=1 Tax=Thiohalobacter sp. IOR34 TaxID=3057176 RepID=UPI0025B1312C|nr:TIGR04283 family arsenosugar biosynthesis glycosyltransferase [Thiohalobacter sp. IOR34]WJW76510.1 TIGR04283 family arsenosugar biosynthesis glycosyltransferase [Thiohalobacter sp. IOR34]
MVKENSISVVVPALNEAGGIAAMLKRLDGLRARGGEVILVDGGSTDGTLEQASCHVDRVVQSAPGRARQMNVGAAAARGDILWFLHADTLASPDADRLILAALARRRRWGRFDVRLSGRHPLLRLVERMMNLRSRLSGIATGDQGIFVSRDLFESLGGFPEQPLMEDIEICRRLRRASGWPACLSPPLVTSSRRWETAGVVRTILLMWGLRLAYFCGVPAHRLAARYRRV